MIFSSIKLSTQFESRAIEITLSNQSLEEVKATIIFYFFYSRYILEFHDDINKEQYLLSG